MINTTIISAEASASTQVGGKGKGATKGEPQGLFSKLLASLQQGSPKQNQGKDTIPTTKNEVTHTALVADKSSKKEGKKLSAETTNDNNNPNLKHKKLNNSETVVASVQQAPLVTQSILQKDEKVAQIVQQAEKIPVLKQFTNKHETTQFNLQQKPINMGQQTTFSQKTESSPAATQPQSIINTNTTPMIIEAQPNVSKQPIQNIEVKTLKAGLATPATTLKNTVEDGVTVKQNNTPRLLNNTTGKDHPTSLANEDNTLNATKKSLPVQQTISDEKIIDKADSLPIRGKEVTVVTTQQRTAAQEQSPASLFTQAIQSKNMDNKGGTSQQDFSSNQQHMNASTLDMNSVDNKGKGIDFQAQLAYRSQRSFTPSDTMLAIVKSAKDGKTSLELQLEPANLGKVQVSIQIDAQKQIQVAFTVEQQASRQALEQHMPQLRLALAQQGLDLGGFSMQMQQQHQEQNQSSTQHSGLNSELLADVDLEIMQENRMGVNIAVDGRLSILA